MPIQRSLRGGFGGMGFLLKKALPPRRDGGEYRIPNTECRSTNKRRRKAGGMGGCEGTRAGLPNRPTIHTSNHPSCHIHCDDEPPRARST